MHKATFAIAGGVGLFAVLVACVGGPGQLPGPDDENNKGEEFVPPGVAPTATGTAKPPNTQSIKASEFDRSCKVDEDCAAVFEGQVCATCKCANAAIAKKDQGKYSSEQAKRGSDCSSGDVACGPCNTPQVGCDPNTKQCAVGKTSKVVDAGP